MASSPEPEESIFAALQKPVESKLQEKKTKLAQERERTHHEAAQRRLLELVETNSTLPCTINSIRILNAPNTRKGFLGKIFEPILSRNHGSPLTFSQALREVSLGAEKLHKFDIFHQPISIFVDKSSPTDPNSTPTDIDVFLTVKEKSRIKLQTGTEVGNLEGSAYSSLLLRNIFGGAESLSVNAALGTRTRSAYQATFDTPILSNPNLRWEFGGLATSTDKTWASHEEVIKGGWTKLRWMLPGGYSHDFEYAGSWRQITGLSAKASPSVRAAAGDSVKSSIKHTWISEQRDHPLLPTRGYLLKTISEIAGWGPLRGDVAWWKSEVNTQTALPIPLPGVKGDSGVTFTTGLRAGLLYPLGIGTDPTPQPSRLNDRFQIGGPTDVRGFRVSGIGPRDGTDALGGDVYAAGSANLLVPVPGVGKHHPLRFQVFVNGARSLALKESEREASMDGTAVRKSVYSTVAELGNGLPTMAAGLGLVYAHPAARFELNFSLPLVVRKGEDARKGFQFGIGMEYL